MGIPLVRWGGRYFSGRDAARHPATVFILPDRLKIQLADSSFEWRYSEVRQTQGFLRGEPVRLERGSEGEALVVSDPAFLGSLREVAPEFRGRLRVPAGRRRVYILAAAGLAVIGLAGAAYLWGIPALAAWAAYRVPPEWEKGLGYSTLSFLAPLDKRVEEQKIISVTDRIAGRLNSAIGDTDTVCRVIVARRSLVNAYCLPGGFLVLNAGLIACTRSAEELAGVLAHEIQHARHRHVTKALIQRLAGGMLSAALVGDIGGAMEFGGDSARVIMELRYSRAAEREADIGAVELLEAAGIDPAGLPAFLNRMDRDRSDHRLLPAYLGTHPQSTERVRQIIKRIICERHYAPLMPDVDWEEIRLLCASERDEPRECPMMRKG